MYIDIHLEEQEIQKIINVMMHAADQVIDDMFTNRLDYLRSIKDEDYMNGKIVEFKLKIRESIHDHVDWSHQFQLGYVDYKQEEEEKGQIV
jgi:hypothetical protein